jgi:hypothetical protein
MRGLCLGEKIWHMKGLRQGAPLSSLLFLLMMEFLSAMIRQGDAWLIFAPLGTQPLHNHASLYANDLIIFLSLIEQDLRLIYCIFNSLKMLQGWHVT